MLHHSGGNLGVKTGQQSPVVHVVDGAAVDHLAGVGQVDLHPPAQQAGVEQVQVGAVLLDVGHHAADGLLGVFLRVVVDILHVALVHPEDAEANVQVSVRVLGLDLVPRSADALFADLTDIFISSLEGLGLFITRFRQLHHDEFAAPAVLGVELHDRVGSGGRAGEEI